MIPSFKIGTTVLSLKTGTGMLKFPFQKSKSLPTYGKSMCDTVNLNGLLTLTVHVTFSTLNI